MRGAVALAVVLALLGVLIVGRLAGVPVSRDPYLRNMRPSTDEEAVAYRLDWGTTSSGSTYTVALLARVHDSDDGGERIWSGDKAKPERLTWRGPDTLVVGVGIADFDRRKKIKVSRRRGVTVLTEWLSVDDLAPKP